KVTKFLDDYVVEKYDRWNPNGNNDHLTPDADAMMRILVGEQKSDGTITKITLDGTEPSYNAFVQRIENILDTPEAWVMVKPLIQQELAKKRSSLGLANALDTTKKIRNPMDLVQVLKDDPIRARAFRDGALRTAY